jgi:acetoin utilization deacetylase AcuC-like enzyme
VGLWFSHPASLAHDPAALHPGHPDRPERLAAVEAVMEAGGWAGWERREAPRATDRLLHSVHTPDHVDAIREACARGEPIDADTVVGPASFEAALRAAGGACALVDALLDGAAEVGLSALRPSGHHAGAHRAMGFCLFNNVALAAQHAVVRGAERVAVIDWDVHHGNGTNDIFRRRADVLFASIHQARLFPGTGELTDAGAGPGEGFSINLPVPAGTDGEVWLSLLEHVVVAAADAFAPQLVLVSAGFDAHHADPLGGCALDEEAFAEMARHARDLARRHGAPLGLVLEGGYDPPSLAASVAAVAGALHDDRPAGSIAPDPIHTPRAASFVGHHWEL